MSVATIIVNYNAGETLQKCVNAVLSSSIHTRVTVVDNASDDGSAQNLRNLYGDRQGVEFLFNPSNPGFGPAINAVAQRLVADWILILNPDCILERTALAQLVSALENDSAAALAGPAVRDESGRIQRATLRRFPNPWRSFLTASGLWRLGRWFSLFKGVEINSKTRDMGISVVDATSGACMLVRKTAFESVGYMDEDYKMHCEDLDLMYRLSEDGWHCLFVPQANCLHLQGLSSRSRPTWVHFQKHRGMIRFFRKFQAKSTSAPVRLMVYIGIWLRFIILWPLVILKR